MGDSWVIPSVTSLTERSVVQSLVPQRLNQLSKIFKLFKCLLAQARVVQDFFNLSNSIQNEIINNW